MNIILAIIDTLRFDCIAAHGRRDVQTPNFDRFAAESWVFTNSYTSSYPTIPHRTDVITGMYGNPFHVWQPLPWEAPTLPEALAREGYATQLIHDTPHLVNGGHNFDYPFHAWTQIRGAEVDRSFITDELPLPDNWARDPLFDAQPEAGSPPDYPGRAPNRDTYARANRSRRSHEEWNCAKLFRSVEEFVRSNTTRDNFFLWIDCFDPHEPWDAPPEYVLKYDTTPGYDGKIDPRTFDGTWRNQPLTDAAVKRIQACYAAKVSWVDHWFAVMLDALEETGLKKNTAVILTADHGTNDGTANGFGKKMPPREGEAHTPFIVYAPGAGSGTSDMIVQPQDVYATVMGLVGGPVPGSLDSHDVLSQAMAGEPGSRQLAIAGRPPTEEDPRFTAFDGEWCVEVGLRPGDGSLVRMGELEDVSAQHPDVAARLRTAAIDELDRRGADPAVVSWYRAEGREPYPATATPHRYFPRPAGYEQYFRRLYRGE